MRLLFAEITAALKAAGYRVSCRELNAWWYGVPQDRRRLIWVGLRGDLGLAPSHPAPSARRAVPVAEALGSVSVGSIRNAQYRNGRRPPELPAPMLEAAKAPMVRERHSPAVVEAWAASRPGQSLRRARRFVGSFQSVRLDPSRPSPTQTAAHRNWRWDEPRYLTLEEAKVLQGFPVSFWIGAYRLLGNSVPPPLAEAVGRHVAGLLAGAERGHARAR